LVRALEIRKGVTAVIGGGGKTTLLRSLGERLAEKHRVLLCTTTKIFPFSGISCAYDADTLEALRKEHHLLCMGSLSAEGKLTAPEIPMAELMGKFDYILVEADGSKGRPMKAHAPYEPVVPSEANQTICVLGASGFWRPIAEAAHRPERYAALAGVSVQEELTPEIAAAVLKAEALHDKIYVNQVEDLAQLLDAKELAAWMDGPVLAGSLQRREYFKCW